MPFDLYLDQKEIARNRYQNKIQCQQIQSILQHLFCKKKNSKQKKDEQKNEEEEPEPAEFLTEGSISVIAQSLDIYREYDINATVLHTILTYFDVYHCELLQLLPKH
jgi:hypothetical protein